MIPPFPKSENERYLMSCCLFHFSSGFMVGCFAFRRPAVYIYLHVYMNKPVLFFSINKFTLCEFYASRILFFCLKNSKNVLSLLKGGCRFESGNPKGMIPDTIPSRAPFDLVQGFGSSSMTLYTFHKLSRQIVLAAKPGFDVTTLSSYSARRLLPSVAELWHVPTEMRNKIGGWNKDEVREQVKNRMPDRYSHFKLESALQVKTTIVRNLARLVGDIRASSDLST